MKTTIELPDDLLERVKAVARRENSTLKALMEGAPNGAESTLAIEDSTLFGAAVPGDGLMPEFAAADWQKIRDEIYRDRG